MRLLRGLEAVHASRNVLRIYVKGVKSMLTCSLWLQIYVSVVNRYIENYFNYYRKSVTYDVLLIFPRLFDKLKCSMLSNLCRDGDLRDLIKIHARFEWSLYDVRYHRNSAFIWACCYGHLDVIKWLYTTLQLTVNDVRCDHNHAFRSARDCGHKDVCNWLVATFGDSVGKSVGILQLI